MIVKNKLKYFYQVSKEERLEVNINLIEFSCSNSIFHLRDGAKKFDEIIFETEEDVRTKNVQKNSTTDIFGLEFNAPRRSCRIYLRLTATAFSKYT